MIRKARWAPWLIAGLVLAGIAIATATDEPPTQPAVTREAPR